MICSTDEIYAERAFDVARRLRQAGAEHVLLAGRPGEREATFREAGIDDFVYVGVDVLAHLRALHEVLEVRP